MELNYLREFVMLAATCQFVEAAERLYMSQSSLSKHIKILEKELGIDLFDRSTRKVELTRFGKAFLPYAKRIVAVQSEYTNVLMPEFSAEASVITIGVAPMVSFLSISNILSAFPSLNNEYRISIFEADDNAMFEALRSGKCTAAISGVRPDTVEGFSDFDAVELFEDSLVALLPVGHPLSVRETVSVEDVAKFPYIHAGRDANCNPALGVPILSASHSTMIIELVRRGFGISIVTKQVALNCEDDRLTYVAMSPSPTIKISMLFNKGRSYSREVRMLVEHMQGAGYQISGGA